MPLPFALSEKWSRYAPRRAFTRCLALNEEGLQLGKTILAHWHEDALMLEEDRLRALLSVAFSSHVSHDVIRSIRRAEKSWRHGYKTLALMHLALTGISEIDYEQAQRLFAAEWGCNRGVTPAQLLKFAGLGKGDDGNSRYNPDEPRIPAGQPGGGQWTSGGDGGTFASIDDSHDRIDESYGLDAVIGSAGAAAELALEGEAAVAALTARARATITSAMATVTAMGNSATEKAQELYDVVQETVNSWLQDNGPNADRVIGPMQRFGEDDLVYGPEADGALKLLVLQNGGSLLSNKPNDMNWMVFSLNTLDRAAESGSQVHFDLTNMNEIDNVLAGAGKYANTITGEELRYIMDNWDSFAVKPKFYYYGSEVLAPWIK